MFLGGTSVETIIVIVCVSVGHMAAHYSSTLCVAVVFIVLAGAQMWYSIISLACVAWDSSSRQCGMRFWFKPVTDKFLVQLSMCGMRF
jgi:hypothetical protein